MEPDTSCRLDTSGGTETGDWLVEAVESTRSLPDTGLLSEGAAEDAEMVANRRQRLEATRNVRRRDKLKKHLMHSWTLWLRSSSSQRGSAPFVHRLSASGGSRDTPQPRLGEGKLSGGSCCAGPDHLRRVQHQLDTYYSSVFCFICDMFYFGISSMFACQ